MPRRENRAFGLYADIHARNAPLADWSFEDSVVRHFPDYPFQHDGRYFYHLSVALFRTNPFPGPKDLAMEAFIDTCVKCNERFLDRADEIENPEGYFRKTLRHESLAIIRRESRALPRDLVSLESLTDGEHPADEVASFAEVDHYAVTLYAIQLVPAARQREYLELRYIQDLSRRDICKRLGISDSAEKALARRARMALGDAVRDLLEGTPFDSPSDPFHPDS